jgi:hypothetical protein
MKTESQQALLKYDTDAGDMTIVTKQMQLGNCAVCGVKVENSTTASCEKCETQYHKDCWDYMGACSIYGCGCKKATILHHDRIPEQLQTV